MLKTVDNIGDNVYKTVKIWLIIVSFVFLTMKTRKRITGDIGEGIACFYLKKHGFIIKDRNYLKKWGEIDIVAIKDDVLHFIEVKSIKDRGEGARYRPEENVTNLKLKKLRKMIQIYMSDKKYDHEKIFQFHVITVTINIETGKSLVKMLENIIL